MTTLVVCVDRDGAVATASGAPGPVAGWDAVRDLVTEIGLDDPEDSRVNCLLEALRVTRDLRSEGEESVVAVVTGTDGDDHDLDADGGSRSEAHLDTTIDTDRASHAGPDAGIEASRGPARPPMSQSRSQPAEGAVRQGVGADRIIARQVDTLISRYDPESAVVVVASAEDERLVPIVESRIRVDAVDRVVVRQARDIESAYYLLKQFLADEELRQTILVPMGFGLLVFPVLLALTDRLATALAAIAGVTGFFLLYKGLGIDDRLSTAAGGVHEALYSGQVSIVTYVVAVGLALVGVFAGAIAASSMSAGGSGSDVVLPAMRFAFEGVPWFAAAALVASAGRLLDEIIRTDRVRSSSLNLPFGVVAVGLVVRGFAAYFLERAGAVGALSIPSLRLGAVSVRGFSLAPGTRLAAFVIGGVLVSLVGVQIAARADTDDPDGDSEGLLE